LAAPIFEPYWGKPTVRNLRGGDGNGWKRTAPSPYPTAAVLADQAPRPNLTPGGHPRPMGRPWSGAELFRATTYSQHQLRKRWPVIHDRSIRNRARRGISNAGGTRYRVRAQFSPQSSGGCLDHPFRTPPGPWCAIATRPVAIFSKKKNSESCIKCEAEGVTIRPAGASVRSVGSGTKRSHRTIDPPPITHCTLPHRDTKDIFQKSNRLSDL
jgi:hypothetical protein